MGFNLSSTAFEEDANIPTKHSCKGDDTSPPLRWDEVPGGTASFALILEDPDAPNGTFCHWIVYNLPEDCRELEAVIPIQKKLDNGAMQGQNDFGKIGYGGPCPPQGEEHRYFFRLFALKKKLSPESANRSEDFYNAVNGLILGKAEYMGRFKK
nr:YbhB/YbcL family Raf kinase inhibitor-like protein [Sunxiuqinia sp.]